MEENLFDPIESETTVSGFEDLADNVHTICYICGGVNGDHYPECDVIAGWVIE